MDNEFEGSLKIRTKHCYTTWHYKSKPKQKTVNEHELRIVTDIGALPEKANIFIYPYGSGIPELDEYIGNSASTISLNGFVPPIPFIYEKKEIEGRLRELSEKAFKKSTRKRYKKILDKLLDNEEVVKNVNYVYSFYGASLNSKNKYVLRYIFNFLADMNDATQNFGNALYDQFLDEWKKADDSVEAYNNWLSEYGINRNWVAEVPSNVEIPEPPEIIPYPKLPKVTWEYTAEPQYKIVITYNSSERTSGTGLGRDGAKKGDIWTEVLEPVELEIKEKLESENEENFYSNKPAFRPQDNLKIESFAITYQTSSNTWEKLTCRGLMHSNVIYGNKSVDITATEALEDEEESAFLVPLNNFLLKRIGLVAATQVVLEGHFLVFNSYKVVKQRWYQRGIFKVIMVIAAIVIAIYFPPKAGVLGETVALASTIATATGVTAATAATLAAVANAMAAMILSTVIVSVSTKLFGDKVGNIIGTIVSLYAVNYFSTGNVTLSFDKVFQEFTKVDNLIKFTSQIVDMYARSEIKDIVAETQQLMENYKERSEYISEMYQKNFGNTASDSIKKLLADAIKYERPEQFLARTLMTGSDIANLTNSQISEFVAMTTSLQLR